MKKCGKSRCQICKFVEEGKSFCDGLGNRKCYINYDFDCDSAGIFASLDVRSVANSILEVQSRRLENALITTRVVCLGMEGLRGGYRGSIYMYISFGRAMGDWMILWFL